MKSGFKIDDPFKNKEKKEYDPWEPVYAVDPKLADQFLEDSELELEQES